MRTIKAVELIIIVLFLLSLAILGFIYLIGYHTRRLRKEHEFSSANKKA